MAFLAQSGDQLYWFTSDYIGGNANLKGWVYVTLDDAETVTASGYFVGVPAPRSISEGDLITVYTVTDRNNLDTTTRTFRLRVIDISISTGALTVEIESIGSSGSSPALTFATATAATAAAAEVGDVIRTLGYATAGDGGGARYEVVDTNPGAGGFALAAPGKYAKITNENVDIRKFGAKGDGTTDCDTAFSDSQEWIAGEITAGRQGRPIPLAPGDTYVLNTRLAVGDYGGFVCPQPRSAIVYAPSSSFNNADMAGRYGDNAAIFDLSGLTSGAFTPRKRPVLRGVVIQSQVSDGRVVDAIVARNCDGAIIELNEAFGFPVGCGIRASSLVGDTRLCRNYFHDFTTNATSYTSPQSTGIELDGDRVNSVNSDGWLIARNVIRDLTFGADAIAAYGYQTDGINTQLCTGGRILANDLRNVGEGIDHWGTHCVLGDNITRDTYNFGIKLIHGAQHNKVHDNDILRAGIAGIVLANGNIADVAWNEVHHNDIADIDPDGVWGATTTTATIKIDNNGGSSFVVRDNQGHHNTCDPGSNGQYTFARATAAGFVRNHLTDNTAVKSGTSGLIGTSQTAAAGRFSTTTRTHLLAYAGTAGTTLTAGSSVLVKFDTTAYDEKSEYSAATGKVTIQEPGFYSLLGQVCVLTTMTAGKSIGIFLLLNGSALATNAVVVEEATVVEGVFPSVSARRWLNIGDVVWLQVRNDDTADRPVMTGQNYSFLAVDRVG